MRNLPQFAKIPQGMHGVALLLLYMAFSCSTLEDGCHLPSCGLVPRLGGLGHQNFFLAYLAVREAALAASGAQGVLRVAA